MSSPITPLQGPAHSSTLASAAAHDGAGFASELAASERSAAVDVLRGGPPSEVLSQIAAAGRVHDQLQQDGRELRFSLHEPDVRVQIELLDNDNDSARIVSSTEALDIAAGKPLE